MYSVNNFIPKLGKPPETPEVVATGSSGWVAFYTPKAIIAIVYVKQKRICIITEPDCIENKKDKK